MFSIRSWSSLTSDMFSNVTKMLMEPEGVVSFKGTDGTDYGRLPTGFKFGYTDDSAITYEDLLYVNPEADPNDESTWFYDKTEEEKTLGKSATENPRVFFLDPRNPIFPALDQEITCPVVLVREMIMLLNEE